MRASSVASEALRNLATGTSRATLLAVIFAMVVGGLALADARSVIAIQTGALTFQKSAASVRTIEAVSQIDGHQCELIASTGDTGASGAMRKGSPLTARAMPSSQLPVWEVTPGLLSVLSASTDPFAVSGGGVWLENSLAEVLSAQPGDVIETSSGSATVAGVYQWPDDGRARTLGYSVLSPVPAAGLFDECWVDSWPAGEEAVELLQITLIPGAAVAEAPQAQLNTSLGAEYDTDALLDSRVTAWASVASLCIGLALGWSSVRSRRLQLAAALHGRVPRPHLGWQILIETLAWVCAGGIMCLTVIAWTTGGLDVASEAWSAALRTVMAAGLATLVGAWGAVAATRERHLFSYFKDR